MSPAHTPAWLLGLIVAMSASCPAYSAQYAVDGVTLGTRAVGTPNYQSYTCRPSDDFPGFTWCQRTQQRPGKAATIVLSNTLVHGQDGTAVYLMTNAAPMMLGKAAVQRELDDLSREIRETPASVNWLPPTQGVPTSLIATWGKARLEELRGDALDAVSAGKAAKAGVLVDTLGDLQRSAKAQLPVYRIVGGAGYVYAASFDESGRGHRHYVAIDATPLSVAQFEAALPAVLQQDQNRASDDFGLWPEVAKLTRRLSRDTSAPLANDTLDRVYARFPAKKLHSHVWSLIPGGTILHLEANQYGTIDIYREKTEHPDIRRNIQQFIAQQPRAPFIEFLHYTVGDFDKALQASPRSPIRTVLHYAIGHSIMDSLLDETIRTLKSRGNQKIENYDGVNWSLLLLNSSPELYDRKPLNQVVANFAARAAVARPHFEAVLRETSSPHADDAAYMLGWLAFHEGKTQEAMAYFSKAMAIGNGDYTAPAATRQTVRLLTRFPASEQLKTVDTDANFGKQSALWYLAARSAYREFNYDLAIDAADRALKKLNVSLDSLPASTDPNRIDDALQRINPDLRYDANFVEIPYIYQAAREMSAYQKYLASADADRPENLLKRARPIILKYSLLNEKQPDPAMRPRPSELAHKDLRQAKHLIDITLERAPKTQPYAAVREWLHYRKIRVLAVYEPKSVGDAILAFQQEFPQSKLLDDALAEQIYAQGVMMKDVQGAERTFRKLLETYPTANAVDNAYTWMAIIYRCAGRTQDADKINREIIRKFPLSRHAKYARERMAQPTECHVRAYTDGDPT